MYTYRRKGEKANFFKFFDKNYEKEGYSKFFVSDFVKLNYFLDLTKKEIKFFKKGGIYYILTNQIPEFHNLFVKHLKNYLEKTK